VHRWLPVREAQRVFYDAPTSAAEDDDTHERRPRGNKYAY
jgi:hypothetical protein